LDLPSLLVILTGGLWCVLGGYWAMVAGRVPRLPAQVPPLPDGVRVSVIVTACNEADTIEPAMASLQSLSLPGLEFIVVNDRSTDETGAIIDQMALDDDRVRVLHIDTLPEDWLGKVHAMHRATELATGDWLLFTDADVVFHPGVIGRAVGHAEDLDLDHLTLVPAMVGDSILLDLTVIAFFQLVCHMVFGWARIPFGAGAFNLLRRTTFERSEGIEWLRMEVADDTGLAYLITNAGGTSHAATALNGLSLSWYPTLGSMFRGLEKNAGLLASQGQPWRVFLGWFAGTSAILAPLIGVALRPDHWPIVVTGFGLFAFATFRLRLRMDGRLWLAPFAPIGLFLVGTCGLWSMIQILRTGGINWRGTTYPWDKLVKGQRVKL
jgi:glycosyltransferase involved in cell wall biosynthesis